MFIEIEYFPCSLNQILTKYQAVHYRDENGLHGFLVGNEVEIFKLHCDSTTSRFCVDTIFKSAVTNQPYCQITSFTVLPKVGIYPECLVVCLRNNETQLLEEGDATRDILFFELRSLIYPPNSDKSLSTLPLQILKLQSIPVSINCITLGLGNYERLNALVIFNGNHSAKIFTPNRKDSGKFAEVDYKECEMLFPDLIMKPFTSTALSFHYISWLGNVNHGRITGCADGSIRLAWSPETGLTVWESIILDGPITGVQVLDTDNAEVMDVIACTVLGTVAYIRLSNSGEISFASEQINDLEIGDALMCIRKGKFNTSGSLDVFAGTYFGRLICLKSRLHSHLQTISGLNKYRQNMEAVSNSKETSLLKMGWHRNFPFPVYELKLGDFNHDGIEELIVVTKHGIHIMQCTSGVSDFLSSLDKLSLLTDSE